jgi:CheY-like chemotaxis protein
MSINKSVLIIEDRDDFAGRLSEELLARGILAEKVIGFDVGGIYDQIRNTYFADYYLEKLPNKQWDVIILDINFPRDKFGGIFLYNKLAGSHRECWRETIVFSLYAPSDREGNSMLQASTILEPECFVLRVFADTAKIDLGNVISNKIGGLTPLVDRIAKL